MAIQKIKTSRFGDVEVEDESVIRFVSPILGFEDLVHYVILEHSEESPFHWLQSLENLELAFVITNPSLFGIKYEFPLRQEVAESLDVQDPADLVVFTIANIPEDDPSKMTANLLGPLIVNLKSQRGIQIVLNPDEYSTETRLIPDELLKAKK